VTIYDALVPAELSSMAGCGEDVLSTLFNVIGITGNVAGDAAAIIIGNVVIATTYQYSRNYASITKIILLLTKFSDVCCLPLSVRQQQIFIDVVQLICAVISIHNAMTILLDLDCLPHPPCSPVRLTCNGCCLIPADDVTFCVM